MAEWPVVRFEELAANEKSSFSKPYGSAYTKDDYVPDGVPVVRGINLASGRFHDADYVFVTPTKADALPGANLRPGDLVITHRGTIGQVSMIPRVPNFSRYVLSTSQVKARLNTALACPEFYYYWFQSGAGQHALLSHVSTVGVPGLVQPVATVKGLQVPHPPLVEQRAIAAVLGALDDKIAVNQRIAAGVDALAASLFEQAVSSESGSTETTLSDVATVNPQKVKPAATGNVRYIDISAVGVGRYVVPEAIAWDSAPGRARNGARVGDTLWSTVRPNRRAHALVMDDCADLVFSTGLAVLRPCGVGAATFYEATRLPDFQNYLERVAEGSAYPAVQAAKFAHAPIVLPPRESRERFETTVMSMRLRAHQATQESRTLTALRDTLLPQLMSGKLRVRDAERTVEDAV